MQASRYACHMMCVNFFALDPGSLSFFALPPLRLASLCPAQVPWPGPAEEKGRAVVCGGPVNTVAQLQPQLLALAPATYPSQPATAAPLRLPGSSGDPWAGPQPPANLGLTLRGERGYLTAARALQTSGVSYPPGGPTTGVERTRAGGRISVASSTANAGH